LSTAPCDECKVSDEVASKSPRRNHSSAET